MGLGGKEEVGSGLGGGVEGVGEGDYRCGS